MIDVDAKDAPSWRDVGDVPAARVDEVREWYRMYKTAEGKGVNEYGLDGKAVNAAHARRPPSNPPVPSVADRTPFEPPRAEALCAAMRAVRDRGRAVWALRGRGSSEPPACAGRTTVASPPWRGQALKVAQHTHKFWADMMAKAKAGTPGGGCEFDKNGICWTKYSITKDEL